MRWKKRYWSRLFLGVEIVVFGLFYWFGADGFRNLHKFNHEKSMLEQEVRVLSGEIDQLNNEVIAFEQDIFYREKLAREQLQMARKNEEIFLVTQ
jgi:cell division protein FtsB